MQFGGRDRLAFAPLSQTQGFESTHSNVMMTRMRVLTARQACVLLQTAWQAWVHVIAESGKGRSMCAVTDSMASMCAVTDSMASMGACYC
ncbi:hypothetical protein D8674_017438 [Pyrus ussuriensis x Pyrus communis]|uniref:Uncharacterized protein n=1 Tax=Pyrus ussuriensis x Pyrus communis TaxID=2448454 RepID=A0A5N5HDQ8_9ROSA|nr:hypothetical protein D8674_017438 [Pyrus ussuriensis x Pyrus communis]